MVVVWGVWEINVWRVDERILKSPAAALEGGARKRFILIHFGIFRGEER